mgnify:FL=1
MNNQLERDFENEFNLKNKYPDIFSNVEVELGYSKGGAVGLYRADDKETVKAVWREMSRQDAARLILDNKESPNDK